MTNEEFEKLYSAKLAEREYPFNPDNWAAMEGILNQRMVSKGYYIWTSAATLIFGAVVASLLWFAPSPTSMGQDDSKNVVSQEKSDTTPKSNNVTSKVKEITTQINQDLGTFQDQSRNSNFFITDRF